LIEFDKPSEFEYFAPQIGAGPLPGGGGLASSFTLVNLSTTTALAQVEFFDSDGQSFPILREPSSGDESHDLVIPPFRQVELTTSGNNATAVSGYARIVSSAPLHGTVRFMTEAADGTVSEAGITTDRPRTMWIGAMKRKLPGIPVGPDFEFPPSRDSAIAVVNTSDAMALVRFRLLDSSGDFRVTQRALPPHGHLARFLTELFPTLTVENFDGTMVVTSDQPVVATILFVEEGIPISSLPLGSLEEGH